MNNTELANFKKKLSIELETTTSDEAQLISNIVDSASAGALPAVSADDNGKVLTVSSGAWAAAQPSGSGGIMVVTGTYDESTDTTTLNKTWQEIYDAFANGVLPVYKMVDVVEGQTSVIIHYLNGIMGSDEIYRVFFAGVSPIAGGTINSIIFTCNSPNDYPTTQG